MIAKLRISMIDNLPKETLDNLIFEVGHDGEKKELRIREEFKFEINSQTEEKIAARVTLGKKSVWHKLVSIPCAPKQLQESITLTLSNTINSRATLFVHVVPKAAFLLDKGVSKGANLLDKGVSKGANLLDKIPSKLANMTKSKINGTFKKSVEENKTIEPKVKTINSQVLISKPIEKNIDSNTEGSIMQSSQVIEPIKDDQANIEELTQKLNKIEAALTKLEPDLVLNDISLLKGIIQALEQKIPSLEAQVESLNKNDSIVEMERNLQKTIEQKAKENETILTFKVQSESQKRIAEKKEMSDEMRRLSEKVEQIELNLQEISRVPQEIRELEAKFNSLETRMVEGFEEINRKLNSLTLQNTNGTKVQHQSEVIEEEWFFANDDTRYHKQGCAQILSDAIPLVKEEALAMNLVPCGVCHKEINGINSY
eukprot:TRINITY_DN4657_c0_g1_i4.p1 TRINITY_DN4657_c0_g1~~TRINITY_DN4657_c0_g1_i4.p1  ORF type:complete len:428 (+),score=81.08 TRINITY_DN4657_c0_g1_i4:122-1405(+)